MLINYLRFIFPAAALGLFAALAFQHWQIVTAIVPLEFYEGTVPLITGIIADGGNPYTKHFQPQAAFVYPPLYNIFVAGFTYWFDNTIQLHRAVSAGFIFISVALTGFSAWKTTKSGWHGVAVGALFYAALLYYGTPVAGTNAAGVMLFLASALVPWLYKFNTPSLIFSLFCGLCSFYTKQYFVLGIAIVCLYVFLYISMRRALLLGVSFASLLVSSLVLVHITSPYYLDNTLFAPAAAINMLQSWSTLFVQVQVFVQVYAGIFITLAVIGIVAGRTRGLSSILVNTKNYFRLESRKLSSPLLSKPVDYFLFSSFWASVAIVFWLGKNPGNYMTYLFQLISPFFLIVGLREFARLRGKLTILHPLILVCFYQVFSLLPQDYSIDMKSWKKVEQLIANSNLVLTSPILIDTIVQQGKTAYHNGHTFYFPLAAYKPDFMVKEKKQDRVGAVWKAYIRDLYKTVRQRKFDLILISKLELNGIFRSNPPPGSNEAGTKFLHRYYKRTGKIVLSLTKRRGGGIHTILVYEPRKKPLQRKTQ